MGDYWFTVSLGQRRQHSPGVGRLVALPDEICPPPASRCVSAAGRPDFITPNLPVLDVTRLYSPSPGWRGSRCHSASAEPAELRLSQGHNLLIHCFIARAARPGRHFSTPPLRRRWHRYFAALPRETEVMGE